MVKWKPWSEHHSSNETGEDLSEVL